MDVGGWQMTKNVEIHLCFYLFCPGIFLFHQHTQAYLLKDANVVGETQ